MGKGTVWSAMAWESVVGLWKVKTGKFEQKSAGGSEGARLIATPEKSSCRRNTGGRVGRFRPEEVVLGPARYLPKSRGSVCDGHVVGFNK